MSASPRFLVAILFAGICVTQAGAQTELQGSFGLGYAAQYVHESLPRADRISAFNASARIVRQDRHRFRYRTGIEYLSTGYTGAAFWIYVNGTTPNTGAGEYQIRITHVGIPLALGYQIPISGHLSLVPELGILATYNSGATDRRDLPGATNNHDWQPLPQSQFDDRYKRYSLFGLANLSLHYTIRKWTCLAGPSCYLMTSNLEKHSSIQYVFGPPRSDQREYQLSFNVGVSYRIGKSSLKK